MNEEMKEKIKELVIKLTDATDEREKTIQELIKILKSNTTIPDDIYTSKTPIQIPPEPEPIIETRICYKCKKEKPITQFNICSGNKGGRHSYCKTCFKEYTLIQNEIKKLQHKLEKIGE